MRNTLLVAIAGCAVLIVASAAFYSSNRSSGQAPFDLLTEKEIARRSDDPFAQTAGDPQKARALSVTLAEGPVIKVTAPSGFSLVSPVDFDVSFEPRNGVQVDMQSLRIDYKMGLVWLNVTKRIKKNATIKGSRLFASGADLPAGDHTLRFSVKDKNNKATRAVVTFSVAD